MSRQLVDVRGGYFRAMFPSSTYVVSNHPVCASRSHPSLKRRGMSGDGFMPRFKAALKVDTEESEMFVLLPADTQGVRDAVDVVEPRSNQSDLQYRAIVKSCAVQPLVV